MDYDIKKAKKALQESIDAYKKKRLFVIHYSWDQDSSELCKITFISVKEIGTGKIFTFDATKKNEDKVLLGFLKFYVKHTEYAWLNWGIGNNFYSSNLGQRIKTLRGWSSFYPALDLFDLRTILWQIYEGLPHIDKMILLAQQNNIPTLGALTIDEEKNASSDQIRENSLCRIEIIHLLWDKMINGNFQATPAEPQTGWLLPEEINPKDYISRSDVTSKYKISETSLDRLRDNNPTMRKCRGWITKDGIVKAHPKRCLFHKIDIEEAINNWRSSQDK